MILEQRQHHKNGLGLIWGKMIKIGIDLIKEFPCKLLNAIEPLKGPATTAMVRSSLPAIALLRSVDG